MSQKQDAAVSLRIATKDDAPACGQICFNAFSTISQAHGFPPDFPSPEVATGLLSTLFSTPGFDIREPLSCMQGRVLQRTVPGCGVRRAQDADLANCNALSHQVHGFDRGIELAQAIQQATARVVEREGRITGYATDLAFFGHATAESNLDLQALLASVESFGGPGVLVPSRNNALLRWCLSNGLRVVQPMTLMSSGLYNEPAGSWLPSILF